MIVSNDRMSNPANFLPRLAYFTLHAAKHGVALLMSRKVPNFCQSAVAPNAFLPKF